MIIRCVNTPFFLRIFISFGFFQTPGSAEQNGNRFSKENVYRGPKAQRSNIIIISPSLDLENTVLKNSLVITHNNNIIIVAVQFAFRRVNIRRSPSLKSERRAGNNIITSPHTSTSYFFFFSLFFNNQPIPQRTFT